MPIEVGASIGRIQYSGFGSKTSKELSDHATLLVTIQYTQLEAQEFHCMGLL